MSMPIVNAAQIALSMRHDGTSSLCGKIADAAVLLDSIETEIVDPHLDGWSGMPNDWETVCERIAEYMSDGPVMPARQPDREVILGFINHSEAERKRCPKCGGSCTVFVPNRNPLHDSEIEVACDECGGRGFIR